MYNERKLKNKSRMRILLFMVLSFVIMLIIHTDRIWAATSVTDAADGFSRSTMEYMRLGQNGENTTVGRYGLNYTGNINVYSSPSSGSDDISYISQTLPVWSNSSMGTLYGDNNTTKVVKAYLIWETRKRYDRYDNNANHVSFIMRDGRTRWNIYPDQVYVDDRSSQYVSGWEQPRPRVYCNVADVTNIVRAYGYGDYYVANIPVCLASDLWEQDTGGGGTPTGWQLIVVEENEDYPVRAVTLSMGSKFRFGSAGWEGDTCDNTDAERTTVTMDVELGSGLKTKEYGDVTGQVLFGSINASTSGNGMGVNLYTQQQAGAAKSLRYAGDTPREGGFYRGSDYFAQGHDLCSVLYEVSGLDQGASVFGVDITRVSWNTQLYIGAAVDIAFPGFEARQTTSISDGKVLVKGTITNTSEQENTGIYGGELTVILDPNLTPDLTNYSIAVNGSSASAAVRQGTVTDADGTVHNTVIFSGGGVSSWFKGDKIEYAIYCRISGSGMTRFDNRDQFSGYLKSGGVDTGHWIDKVCTAASGCDALFRVDLTAGTGIQSVSGAGNYTAGSAVVVNAVVKNGYHWTGWSGSYQTNTKQYHFTMPAQNVSMTATAQINRSTLRVNPNGGTWSGSTGVQSFSENYGTAKSIPDPVRTGYTFSGWVKSEPFNGSLNNAFYTFGAADGATDVLTAFWTANSYTLHFDPNDGREKTPVDDMTIAYDQDVTLPDATGLYIRYTLDGEDITQQVLDGTIVLDDTGAVVMMMDADRGLMMTPTGGVVNEDGSITEPDGSITNPDGSITNPDGSVTDPEETEPEASGKVVEEPKEETTEPDASGESMEVPEASGAEEDIDVQVAEAEETEDPEEPEDPTADPVPDKKAYASVFMGWALEDGRESFIPQWTAGTSIAVADLVNAAGVTDQNGATITLYAVWDDCPWIVAENLYYTLTQAQSGYITDSEILSHATAYDREDGSPIEPGFHENGTSFSIPDYQASDFTQFRREGSCTENLTVVDSTGSTYYKQITVYVVDTTAVAVEPEGTTRFINEYYYTQPEANGGLAADSIWLTDPEYAAALQTAFANSRNGTAEEVYEFSHEDILAMKQFIDDNGFGNTRSDDALTRFYNQFMAPNKVE